MKTITYHCDVCGIEINKDKLVTVKIEKNVKHFCSECVSSSDFEKLVMEKSAK